MVIMFVLLLGTAVYFIFVDDFELIYTKKFLKDLFSKNWKKYFSIPDLAVIAFWTCAVISTFGSEYLYESFWGNEGRYSGLFLLTIFFVSYFCITRHWKYRRWYLDAFLFVGVLACLFGITDYFCMDILGFKKNLAHQSYAIFTSTFGNINTYTSYVALVLGSAATLFVLEKEKIRAVLYYVVTIIAFFAMIMGTSDNAYLSMAILFALLPLFVFRKSVMIWRYGVLVTTLFSVIQCIDWINLYYTGPVVGIEGLFSVISKLPFLFPLVIVLWTVIILGYVFIIKKNADQKEKSRYFLGAWILILALALVMVTILLYDVNIKGNVSRYGGLGHYLLFDDSWGTNRGYVWRIAIEDFMKFPLFQKIFGHGPDTFKIVTYANNYAEMTRLYNVTYDNAHNEYIQYLVTNGIAGMVSYIVLIGSSIVYMFRSKVNRQASLALAFAVVCFAAQAVVNINPPIVSPIMWTLLMMGVAISRNGTTDKDVEKNETKRTI